MVGDFDVDLAGHAVLFDFVLFLFGILGVI